MKHKDGLVNQKKPIVTRIGKYAYVPSLSLFPVENETWKDINGYEGYYQISNVGRVKSLARTCVTKGGALRVVEEKIKATSISKVGYELITLYCGGPGLTHKIHRLVAIHFIANPNDLPQVNHKDGNKENNHVLNLEWCTPKENTVHAESTGLRNSKGEGNAFFGKRHTAQNIMLMSEKAKQSIKVLDTQTGIFYDSIKGAAIANSINPVTLNARICRYKVEKRFITI